MSDIFREVDEEVRRDKATEFWSKHASKLVMGALAIVLAVGGWRFYRDYQFKERAALGAQFEAAVAEAEAGKTDALASVAGLKSGTYPVLARFRLASELAAKAKDEAGRKDAVSAFDTLANDASLPAEWRDIARLRAGMVLVDAGSYDEVEKRLTPLSAPGQTFANAAREAIALAAYRAGKFDKALDALQAIVLDADAPANLRQRAEALLAVVRSGPAGAKK